MLLVAVPSKIENWSIQFCNHLQNLNMYEYETAVTFELTNAEGNMTHSRYAKVLEIAKFFLLSDLGFVSGNYPLAPVSARYSFKKEFLFGDVLKVVLRVQKIERKKFTVYAEFLEKEKNEVRATAEQTILFEESFPDSPQARYENSNKAFPYAVRVDPTMTCFDGKIFHHEYIRVLSDAREYFGLYGIPHFKEEAGRKYLLKTIETKMDFFGAAFAGDFLKVKVAASSASIASFWITAEFVTEKKVLAIMQQRIAYATPQGKVQKLSGNVLAGLMGSM